MKKYFLLAAIMPCIFLCCCNDSAKQANAEQKSYEDTKNTLLIKEQKDPAKFLVVNGQNKKNLLGQTVVKGTVKNIATVATFKDVDIKLSFYSKTKALLETDKETVFEVLAAGKSKDFKTKYFAPKGTDSVALEVLAAKVVR